MEEEILYMFLLMFTTMFVALNKRKRRFAVRPLNRRREEEGFYNNLLKNMLLKKDYRMFFKYTRMSPAMFQHLLSLLQRRLQKNRSKRPIPPAHRLIITLHYLSSGCSMQEIAYGHYLGLTTVSNIIKETLEVLWDTLQPKYIKTPSLNEWNKIAEDFWEIWNFPNCIGAIDGKHVNIQAPYHCGSEFFNYKKQHSLVLMAACDAKYKFTLVDIGAAGGHHDSLVFSESNFGHAILENHLNLPTPRALPNSETILPHYFVADAAFPLHKHIMRPYPGKHLPVHKQIFNYRLSRARRCIESTFGILTNRWRILRNTITADYNTCKSVVKAVVVLHNFILHMEDSMSTSERKYTTNINDGETNANSMSIPSVARVGSNYAARETYINREHLTSYLNSPEGSVHWQLNHVLAGSVPPTFRMDVS